MCISDWSSDVCSSDLAEVDLAVDVLFPAERLARVLRAFANEYPTVSLRLNVEALGAVVAMVLDGKAVAGISGPLAADVEEIERMSAGSASLVPVAAPDHPLGRDRKSTRLNSSH